MKSFAFQLLSLVPPKQEQLPNEEDVLIASSEQQQEHSDGFSSEEGDAGEQNEVEMDSTQREASKYKYFIYLIWFCFWATCWMIAIELKFGIVYLLFSALFFIYFNTRTGPKRQDEVSAYSVFNKNCESIKGTLTAEQLAGEMIYGPLAAMRTN